MPLHFAVLKGNINNAKLLLSHGASPNTKDAVSVTPSLYSAWTQDINTNCLTDFSMEIRLYSWQRVLRM